jgi:hypothetical protein
METISFVVNLLTLAAVVIIGLLLKNYLPSYLTEKGKNLATKEDIEQITSKIERIKAQYVSEIENLKADLQNESQVLSRRRDVYDSIAKSLNVFIEGRADTEDQKKEFLKAYASTWLWAPDPVIRALNAFIDLVTVSPSSKTPEQNARKAAYATCVLEMRKDAGFPETELTDDAHRFVSF